MTCNLKCSTTEDTFQNGSSYDYHFMIREN